MSYVRIPFDLSGIIALLNSLGFFTKVRPWNVGDATIQVEVCRFPGDLHTHEVLEVLTPRMVERCTVNGEIDVQGHEWVVVTWQEKRSL